MYLAQITTYSQEQEFLENKSKLPYKCLDFLGEPSSLNVSSNSILNSDYIIGIDSNVRSHLRESESGSMYHSLESVQQGPSSLIVPPSEVKVRQVILNSIRSQIYVVYDEKYKFNLQVESN